ncbi:unnamed protein product, partial [Ectocarpus sp. 8 AP-2014]
LYVRRQSALGRVRVVKSLHLSVGLPSVTVRGWLGFAWGVGDRNGGKSIASRWEIREYSIVQIWLERTSLPNGSMEEVPFGWTSSCTSHAPTRTLHGSHLFEKRVLLVVVGPGYGPPIHQVRLVLLAQHSR